jgi:hypothetical protein
MDKQPTFEFTYYPEFGEAERFSPATKITYTLYRSDLTVIQMQEAFNNFLRACTYHIEDEE